MWVYACALCAFSAAFATAQSGPEAQALPPCADNEVLTQYGLVSGTCMSVFNGQFSKAVNVYYGIPYAAPPVDELRYAPPQQPAFWSGTRDATELTSVCPQNAVGIMWLTHPLWNDYSEDCLTLNVYSPHELSSTPHEPYPVMVWFHGGAFQSGGAIQYPGHFLSTYGIVVVTVNYRLGNLGFLTTADDVVPGNLGLQDQQLALQWVQGNAARFGGDPNMVTIFGQSAGAASSALHMISPASQGLFHQVMLESGTDVNLWSVLNPDSHPEDYGKQLAVAVDCPTEDSAEMVDCLKDVPWRQIRDVHINCTEGWLCLGMMPVIDRDIIPEWPRILHERGEFAKVPVLSGITRDDGALYTFEFVDNPGRPGGFDRYNFTKHLKDDLLYLVAGTLDPKLMDLFYREIDYNYAPWPYLDDGMANLYAYNELITDGGFGVGWDWHSKSQQFSSPVYNYVFDFRSPNASTLIPEWMGVPHMGEIPYVFGLPFLQLNPEVREDSGVIDIIDWNIDDVRVAVYFQQMIANFAKFGNPTPEPVDNPFDPKTTDWKAFTWEDMNYLYVARNPYTDIEYRQRDYAVFNYMVPSTTGFMFDTSRLLEPASAPSTEHASSYRTEQLHEKLLDLYISVFPERWAAWQAMEEALGPF